MRAALITAALLLFASIPASAQTTTTYCDIWPNAISCTEIEGPASAKAGIGSAIANFGRLLGEQKRQEERLDLQRRMVEAYEARARAEAEAAGRKASESARATFRNAYQLVVDHLVQEWKATAEYQTLAGRYKRIASDRGKEVADVFWRRAANKSVEEYVERRWIELTPTLDGSP